MDLDAPAGTPAPWLKVETPVPPGSYELRFTDMIGGKEIPSKANPKLVVE